ncbi:hypothetical protein HK102_005124 [Quaeritorhiza haematococci]|nr:hypothetical protein HK102_005124 [Quaeritorhiza haematococci]
MAPTTSSLPASALETPHLELTRLNHDSSWLISYGPLSIVLDPWLVGPQVDVHPLFSLQRHVKACMTVDEVREKLFERRRRGGNDGGEANSGAEGKDSVEGEEGTNPEEKNQNGDTQVVNSGGTDHHNSGKVCIVVSHSFTDHCHEETLRLFPSDWKVHAAGSKTLKTIEKMNHFQEIVPILAHGPQSKAGEIVQKDGRRAKSVDGSASEAASASVGQTADVKGGIGTLKRSRSTKAILWAGDEPLFYYVPAQNFMDVTHNALIIIMPASSSPAAAMEQQRPATIVYAPHGLKPNTTEKVLSVLTDIQQTLFPPTQSTNTSSPTRFTPTIDLLLVPTNHYRLPVLLGGPVNMGLDAARETVAVLKPRAVATTHEENKEAHGLVAKVAVNTYPTRETDGKGGEGIVDQFVDVAFGSDVRIAV